VVEFSGIRGIWTAWEFAAEEAAGSSTDRVVEEKFS
jgi:hypothetical protein